MKNTMPPNPRYYMNQLAALIATLEKHVQKETNNAIR